MECCSFLGLKVRGSQAQTDASEDKDGAKDFISDMAFMWAGSDTNGACEIAAGSQIHSVCAKLMKLAVLYLKDLKVPWNLGEFGRWCKSSPSAQKLCQYRAVLCQMTQGKLQMRMGRLA